MGCDPRTTDDSDLDTAADCTGRSLNYGYEKLFIGKASTVVNVPKPGTLALLGIGAMRRRNKA